MGVLFACCRIVVLVDLIALIAIPGDIPLHADPASGLLRYSGWPAPQFPADHKQGGPVESFNRKSQNWENSSRSRSD
jgi:hypothetical protein